MNMPAPGTPGFVERLLADRIGLDVASVGAGLIARGVETRMTQLGVRRLEDYQRILLEPTGELQALIEEVVIPESWFFRDDRPFAALREFIRTGWVEQPHRAPLSALCLPCAAGEEPYSIVMAALELGLPRERLRVVAVDISERSIRRAAAGLYGSNSFRGMDPQLQARYFAPVRGKHLLKSAVRSVVRFEQGNVLDPQLLASDPAFDIVFCRNLLIYLDDVARSKAFANLDRLVASGGMLFLGHADRSDHGGSTRFQPIADKGSFAYVKRPAATLPERAVPIARAASVAPAARTSVPARSPSAGAQPPAPPVGQVAAAASSAGPTPDSGVDHGEVLARASMLADQGRYIEATRLIRERIGQASLDARAHFLLGIIQQAAGNAPEAERELTKAVYLDPGHDEALLALALIARRRGDVAAEALFRRRADRVLARKGRP